MAGSITNNAALYKNKTFIYVPPAPPADLIDCSSFILDFAERKFLNVGFDSEDKFNIVIHIITPSRYVSIYEGFLRRIFSLMGNILSFILDVPQKYRKQIFLEDEFTAISNMVYRGENVLVIESKKKEGCRILLDRKNLMKLQYIEESIFETIARKSTVIRPVVLRQFEIIVNYIDREFTNVQSPPKTIEEMIIFIKNLKADDIIKNIDLNFVSQLKMFAAQKLAEKCLRWSGQMSPELFTDSEMRLISPLSPPQYSSMSPMYSHDEEDPSQSRAVDEDHGIEEFLTQATWAPTKSLPIDGTDGQASSLQTDIIKRRRRNSDNFAQYPPWYTSPQYIEPASLQVDENDGPTSFNLSPSILDFTGGKPEKKLNKCNAKRKTI